MPLHRTTPRCPSIVFLGTGYTDVELRLAGRVMAALIKAGYTSLHLAGPRR